MSKIILSSDSSSDLPKDIIEKNNIHITPLHILIGDKDYIDGKDITPSIIFDTYNKYKILPKTAAISPLEYEEYFIEMKKEDEDAHIIHFNIGSRLSSCYQNANIAKDKIKNLHIIDSRNLSTGTGLLILEAIDLIKEDLKINEIINKLEETRQRVKASFIVDSLRYIEAGGRVPKGTTAGTSLFKIKARLGVDPYKNGTIGLDKVYRGEFERALFKYLDDILKNVDKIEKDRIFVTRTEQTDNDSQLMEKIESILKEAGLKEIIFSKAGCTISSHCGPNTLGFLYIEKKIKEFSWNY